MARNRTTREELLCAAVELQQVVTQLDARVTQLQQLGHRLRYLVARVETRAAQARLDDSRPSEVVIL